MRITVELLGRFSIEPPLNAVEVEYLRALAMSGPAREGDPYAVPDHPGLQVLLRRNAHDEPRRRLTDREPPRSCGWAPCAHGCCLSWDGEENFYYPGDWLAYLVENLLGPEAAAASSTSPDLAGFTFDHRLDGVVAASCVESDELWLIVARDNEITEVLLSRPDADEGLAPLPSDVRLLTPLDAGSYVGGTLPRRVEGVRYTVRATGS